jgi:putative tricarboxylic transport membrane protein
MKMSDVVTGAIFLLAGIAIILEARTFPAVGGQAYGSSFFPIILGAGMAIGGSTLAVIAIVKGRVFPLFRQPEWLKHIRAKLSLIIIILSLIFYILVANHLGFCLTVFLIVTGMRVWMKERLLSSILTAFCVTAVFYFLFGTLLRVPLPFGVVERIIY